MFALNLVGRLLAATLVVVSCCVEAAAQDSVPAKDACYGSQCFESIPQAENALRDNIFVHGPSLRRDAVSVYPADPSRMRAKYVQLDRKPATFYEVGYGNYTMSGECAHTNDPNRSYLCKNEADAIQRSFDSIRAQYPTDCQVGPAQVIQDYPTSYNINWEDPYGRRREGYLWFGTKIIGWQFNCSGEISTPKATIWKEQGFVCPSDGDYKVKVGSSDPDEEGERRVIAPYLCESGWTGYIDWKIRQVASCPANGHPCHPATGDKSRQEFDFDFAGRPFYRYYHSLQESQGYELGAGWSRSYSERIGVAGSTIYRVGDDGSYETFREIGTNRYRGENSSDTLLQKLSTGEYRLRRSDGRETRTFDPQGRLISIDNPTDPTNDVELVYEDGRLAAIVGLSGRAAAFRYDNGVLVRVDLPDGNAVRYGYDADGNLIWVDYGNGAIKRYLYHETGLADAVFRNHLTGILSEDGSRYASFGYDSYGRVKSSTLHGAAGDVAKTTLDYDSADNVTVHTETGDTRSYAMQPGLYRHVLGMEDGAGAVARTYDDEGRLQTLVDRRGMLTRHGYTSAYLSSITEAEGTPQQRRTLLQRDGGNRPTGREVQGLQAGSLVPVRIESMKYDASGRLTFQCAIDPAVPGATGYACGSTSFAPEGVRQTAYAYCSSADVAAGACPYVGFVRSIDGPRTDVADVTSYGYYLSDDATCASAPATCPHRKGDLWKTTNAAGHVTEILAYDGAGRILSVKDRNGVVTDFEYHARGWPTAQKVRGTNNASESDDRITRIEYWPTGLVKKVTQPDGAFLLFAYDAAHRLTGVFDNAGNSVYYTLDNAGNRVQEDTMDGGGGLERTLSRVYNQLGQLATQADARANPTDFAYDADGNVETVTDPLDRVTDHDYDPLGRLKRTLQDVGGIAAETKFEYDALDNLTKVTDPKGLNTTYAYNGFGDQTQLVSPDTGTTGYTHDSAGNRKTRTDARGIVSTTSYDALNRPTSVVYADTNYNVAYAYDTASASCLAGETFGKGRLVSMTDASGSTRYCYNRFGDLVRKVQTVNGTAFTVRYAYTKAGQLSAVTYPDGTVVDYVRNPLGQATEVGVTASSDARQVLLTDALYAPYGPARGWSYGNGRWLFLGYDQDYRPTGIYDGDAGGLDLGFGYDPAGNLDRLTRWVDATPVIGFGYDALNRLTQVRDGPTQTPLETYGYDKTGNRTSFQDSGGTRAYAYPATSHRLTSVAGAARTYDAAGNTTAVGGRTFVYGADGRMRQVKQGATVLAEYRYNGRGERVRKTAGGVETYTLYDESGRWLGDYGATGTPIQQAIWLDDLPVGLLVGSGVSQKLHYIESDHLGTPRVVIDPVRNVAVWKWDLKGEAFGSTIPNQNPDGDGAVFVLDMRYPGQRYDSATGLNYNYFRDYEPGSGRYAESDPIGLRGGISTYGYAYQSPLLFTDPTGQIVPVIWGIVEACAAYPPLCVGALGAIGVWMTSPGTKEIADQAEQRNQEYRAYKDFTLRGYQRDPDQCKELKNRIAFLKAANLMRHAWDMRWPNPKYPGGRHADMILRDTETISRLEERLRRECPDECR